MTSKTIASLRKNASKGGKATAEKYGAGFCEARARAGGLAVKARYGQDFYLYMLSCKKKFRGWPRGKPRRWSLKLDL